MRARGWPAPWPAVRDHVGARQHVAGRRDDEAGALPRRWTAPSKYETIVTTPAARRAVDLGRLEAVAGERLGDDMGAPASPGRRLVAHDARSSSVQECGQPTAPRGAGRGAAEHRGDRARAAAGLDAHRAATIRRCGSRGFHVASDGLFRRFPSFPSRRLRGQRERERASSRSRVRARSGRPSPPPARARSQPEAAARGAAAVEAVEALEDLLLRLARDPGAVVGDGQGRPAAVERRPRRARSCRAACARARSRPGSGRSAARARRRRAPATEPARPRLECVPAGAARGGTRRPARSASSARSTAPRCDREPARVEPRQVEQVGGELRQPRHLLAHRAEELLAGRARPAPGRRAARGSRRARRAACAARARRWR